MSTRLLVSMIETIMTNLEPTFYQKEHKALEKEGKALAQALANYVFPMPPKMSREDQALWLNHEDHLWIGDCCTVRLNLSDPIPIPIHASTDVQKSKLTPKLQARVEAYLAAKKELDARHKRASTAVDMLLRSCRTVEQIKQKWPDGYPECMQILFPDGAASGYAVTTPVAEINNALGLPKDV